ncbi:MAG: hypothetical protein ABI680_08780, partial [Chthoniobacteraceae bacterium]
MKSFALALGLFFVGAVGGWYCIPISGPHPPESNQTIAAQSSAAADERAPGPTANVETVLRPDFFSRLHDALNSRGGRMRARALSVIADGLTAAQIQEAIARVAELRLPKRGDIFAQLFARWAELDPIASMTAAQDLPNVGERERAVNAALGSWFERDPQAVEQWVAEMPGGPLTNSVWKTLITAVAVND